MTTVIWLTLVLFTAIGCFFLGSIYTKRQYEHDELEKEVEKAQHSLEQYKQDVADHLASTNKLVSKMRDNYEQLVNHVEETNKILLTDNRSESMPFFSKETTEHLKASLNSLEKNKTKKEPISSQPADYADGESGIFADNRTNKNQTEQA